MTYKHKKSTPENTITINYDKNTLDKQKSFVMCPTAGCTKELQGSWKDYETGEIRDGLKVYKCPACQNEFTVNNFSTNCVPVPDIDGLGIIFNTNSKTIEYKVDGRERFLDTENDTYVYMPLKFIQPNNKFYYLTNDEYDVFTLSDKEIVDMLKAKLSEVK